ncbi:hypothetical protein GCM10022289_06260 [Pedobacter jeongneungensis]|uniref:GLPGLI family protein n=1 Tax=Pedobacter jeongneungensis TaxID=947309 RepID=A0ABP8B666_9SPHI
MKQLLIFLICIVCYNDNGFAIEKNPPKFSIDTSAIIKKIKSDFLAINKQLSLYKKKKRPAFGFSAEGGEVSGYYDKSNLKKIHSIFYGEMGKTEADYYCNNKRLFFLYKKEFSYDKPMYLKDSKVKKTIETRYYLNGDKVIKSIAQPGTSLMLSYDEIKEEFEQIINILNEK